MIFPKWTSERVAVYPNWLGTIGVVITTGFTLTKTFTLSIVREVRVYFER